MSSEYEGGSTVLLKKYIYNRSKNQAYFKNLDLRDFVNSVMERVLTAYETAARKYPDLRLIESEKGRAIHIADMKEKRIADITLKDGRLHCSLCPKDICDHITFAMLLPEI